MPTPVSVNAHHCQFPATPCVRTMFVTRLGVSAANVVATMLSPASHHGTLRLAAKKAVVLLPDFRPKNRAGAKHSTSRPKMTTSSSSVRWTTGLLGEIDE